MIGLNIVFLWSSRKYPRWVENLHGEIVMEQPVTERPRTPGAVEQGQARRAEGTDRRLAAGSRLLTG
jgi:hypothetical protein